MLPLLFQELPMIFLPLSFPTPPGLNAVQSLKSEIKPIVDLVGLSVLLKLWLIDTVLPLIKLLIPEFLWKMFSLAVVLADTDVEEDIPSKPGNIGSPPESSQETETETINGANHTLFLLVVLNAPLKKKLPLPAPSNASPTILEPPLMLKISSTDNLPTLLPLMLQQFKPKLWPTDPLKELSKFMLISTNTPLESMSTRPDNIWEGMPLKSSDGEPPTKDLIIGLLPTLGLTNGEWTDSFKLREEITNAESNLESLLVFPRSDEEIYFL
jgi:hypothetical protein